MPMPSIVGWGNGCGADNFVFRIAVLDFFDGLESCEFGFLEDLL